MVKSSATKWNKANINAYIDSMRLNGLITKAKAQELIDKYTLDAKKDFINSYINEQTGRKEKSIT